MLLKPKPRTDWVNNLRASITVLVVAHHSSLAYTTFASFDKAAYINSTHPVVDPQRWIGLDIFENFNDIFFMSLMFLIGGLFLSKSFQKKGSWLFIRDRFYRLFLPFLLGGTALMLIAYFPSFYLSHHSISISDYIQDFFTTERWPVGPPWFIWVLFLFNLIFALTYKYLDKLYGNMGRKLSQVRRSIKIFFIFYIVTWILYVPLAYSVGMGTWVGYGPFDFQLSRILLYFGYFLMGVALGKANFNTTLFSSESAITRNWKIWVSLALFTYIFLTILTEFDILTNWVKTGKLVEIYGWLIYYSIYTASCVFSSIAFITTFKAIANKSSSLWRSLSDNAYLIYLIHFVFVIWLQFMLLPFEISPFIKFATVFLGALLLSWGLSIVLKKIKYVKEYV